MKNNKLANWSFIIIFLLAWIITGLIVQQDIQITRVWLLGEPLNTALKFLAQLSLSSFIGNLLAWMIFIALSILPILSLKLFKVSYNEHTLSYWIAILMGAFIALAIYGSLNYLFISPLAGIALDFQTQMQATLISITLGLFILILILSLQWPIRDETQLIRRFQTYLWLIAYLSSALMGILSALVLNPTFQNFQADGFNALIQLFAQLLPVLLLIRLIPDINQLIEQYGKDGFSTQLRPLLNRITTKNAQAVVGMFIIPLLYNLVQLLLFSRQRSANFVFNFPWIELILAITILFVIHLLNRAIKLQSENEGFV